MTTTPKPAAERGTASAPTAADRLRDCIAACEADTSPRGAARLEAYRDALAIVERAQTEPDSSPAEEEWAKGVLSDLLCYDGSAATPEEGRTMICPECNGEKIAVVDYDEAECCEITDDCDACNGEGVVDDDETETPEPSAAAGDASRKGDAT
jgi:hypothetical protein